MHSAGITGRCITHMLLRRHQITASIYFNYWCNELPAASHFDPNFWFYMPQRKAGPYVESQTLSMNTHSSSSRMRVIYHNWSATKQRPHPQSVAEISHHSVLSGDSLKVTFWSKKIRICKTSCTVSTGAVLFFFLLHYCYSMRYCMLT